MSSKKVPFNRHKENEEARKKVRQGFKSLLTYSETRPSFSTCKFRSYLILIAFGMLRGRKMKRRASMRSLLSHSRVKAHLDRSLSVGA